MKRNGHGGLPYFVFAVLFGLEVGVVGYCARVSKVEDGPTAGVWVDNGPAVVTIFSNEDSAALGLYKDQRNTKGCDFAVSTGKHGTNFQVVDEKGEIHIFPVTVLLKLVDKKVEREAVGAVPPKK